MDSDQVDILLVEDNPNDAELTVRALRKVSPTKTVRVVRDGAEAVDFLFSRADVASSSTGRLPRVVFLDLKLPKMDGLEVLKAIRSDPRTRGIPTVILTSSREDRDVAACYSLGVNSYVEKPVEFEKFMETVSEVAHYWLTVNEVPR